MSIKHGKNTVGLLQASYGRQIPVFITFYKFGGSGGSKEVYYKGKDIANALRTQGVVIVEFRAYFEKSDAMYMTTQAFIESLPITFSAIELQLSDGSEAFSPLSRAAAAVRHQKTQIIDEGFQRPKDSGKAGMLFRAFGFLDDADVVAEAGQFILIRCVLRATELYLGKRLI